MEKHDVLALQQVQNREGYQEKAILEDDERVDVPARGFRRNSQNAFFDVITNTDSTSQQNNSFKSVLCKDEMEKKRHYNKRIMETRDLLTVNILNWA